MRTGSCTLPFLGRCTLRVVLRCISTTTKHLHFNAVYFGGVALDLLAVSPLPGAVAPFEIDLGALFQVLTSDFCQTTFKHNTVPLSMLSLLARLLIAPRIRCCNVEVGNGSSAWHVANFRVRTEITDQNYFVDAFRHHDLQVIWRGPTPLSGSKPP
ncbi:Uncharacterised protein [Vibrio cholerae]|uniref:Uncharacterized protein n=1 Tax=Vibrio cholerae TaxID=666 RepID=A0A656AZY3_VIBCL|nr:Uncharacterised protein [Vibrio cholerae]